MAEPTPAAASPSSVSPSSFWISRETFPLWRRVLATLGAGVAMGVLAQVAWPFDAASWVEAALLALALFGMHTRRVELHVLCRAGWWGLLGLGAIGALSTVPASQTWGLMGGSALALIAAGRAGLEPGTGAFQPRAMPRALIGMMVVGASVAHLLVLASIAWEIPAEMVAAGLLGLAVVGIGRTRSWGLFAYLGAILATLGIAAYAFWRTEPMAEINLNILFAILHVTIAAVLTLAALPVLGALVVRPRARDSFGKGWGHWAHVALVLGVVTAVGVFELTRSPLFR